MYIYKELRSKLITIEGIKRIIKVLSNINLQYEDFTVSQVTNVSGDSWLTLACIDFLEEIGEIRNIHKIGPMQNWQYRSTRI